MQASRSFYVGHFVFVFLMATVGGMYLRLVRSDPGFVPKGTLTARVACVCVCVCVRACPLGAACGCGAS